MLTVCHNLGKDGRGPIVVRDHNIGKTATTAILIHVVGNKWLDIITWGMVAKKLFPQSVGIRLPDLS